MLATTSTVCAVLDVEQPPEVFAAAVRVVSSADCPCSVAWPSVSIVTALDVEHESVRHAPPPDVNETISETSTPRADVDEAKLTTVPSAKVSEGRRRAVVTHESTLRQGDAVVMLPPDDGLDCLPRKNDGNGCKEIEVTSTCSSTTDTVKLASCPW
jgi:hypothetical protein